jgi:GTPase SAR1 family protein
MEYKKVPSKELSQHHDHAFKLIIIGDSAVGKSCLMKRVMDNVFEADHAVTIGVEFGSFGIEIEGKIIKM